MTADPAAATPDDGRSPLSTSGAARPHRMYLVKRAGGDPATLRRRTTVWAPVLAVALVLATGAVLRYVETTRADDPLTRSGFAAGIRRSFDINARQAECVTEGVYGAYNQAALQRIAATGVAHLPPALWPPITHRLGYCIYGRQVER